MGIKVIAKCDKCGKESTESLEFGHEVSYYDFCAESEYTDSSFGLLCCSCNIEYEKIEEQEKLKAKAEVNRRFWRGE